MNSSFAGQKVGTVAIVGAGVAGIQAALDLANAGFKVHLIEREPTIGGLMAKLDKTFPTNDCSICILAPKLSECERHPNINIITLAEAKALEGSPGNFKLTIVKKPRYIIEELCNNCQLCIQYCPTIMPDAYNEGLNTTKCMHLVTPQAVPALPVLNPNYCLFMQEAMCQICAPVCPHQAIDFSQTDTEMVLEVGAVILAPGAKGIDPKRYVNYGYGVLPNVVTSIEFERILNASGPYKGHLIRPSDGKEPESIAWLQCVGSRDVNKGHAYCSSVCCMYAIKQAFIAKEHSQHPLKTTIFYIDMRTCSKDFEAYYERAKKEGIEFIRSKVHTIFPGSKPGSLLIRYADEEGYLQEAEFDMVVLSVGLETDEATIKMAQNLGIKLDRHHFVDNSCFKPVETSRPGVFVCGTFNGPKDIPETVAEASAAACEAAGILYKQRLTEETKEEIPERDVSNEPPRIGVFVCRCGTNIGGVLDTQALAEYAKTLPNVVYAENNLYTCARETQEKIKEKIKEYNLNRIIVAACTPRTHQPLFQTAIKEAGLNPYLFEMVNIREHCSWVHRRNPEKAIEKAKDLIRMAVAKSQHLVPLKPFSVPVIQKALVIGGGVAGMVAALELAKQDFEVFLVERKDHLGGHALKLNFTWKGENVKAYTEQLVQQVMAHPRIEVLLNAEIVEASGFVGNFHTVVRVNGEERQLEHGAVILATGGDSHKPTSYHYGHHPDVLLSLEFDQELAQETERLKKAKSVVFIQCVESRVPERPYCSKVCCTHSIRSALKLKEINPKVDIYILYRDLRTYGEREDLFLEARRKGILFIRYNLKNTPKVAIIDRKLHVSLNDAILDIPFVIPTDILVLATGIKIKEEVKHIAKLYRCTLDEQLFFKEAHVKLRPVEMATDGVFIAGLAQAPKPIEECITQAKAAAMKASILLSKEELQTDAVVAAVDEKKCIGCGICVPLCPFGALTWQKVGKRRKVKVIAAACKGCGVCAAHCPTHALDINYFRNIQILAQIKAFGES